VKTFVAQKTLQLKQYHADLAKAEADKARIAAPWSTATEWLEGAKARFA